MIAIYLTSGKPPAPAPQQAPTPAVSKSSSRAPTVTPSPSPAKPTHVRWSAETVKNELTDKNQALSASKELEAEIAELIAQKKRIESHAFSLGKLSVQFDSSFPVEDLIDPKLQLSEIHIITDAGVNDIELGA